MIYLNCNNDYLSSKLFTIFKQLSLSHYSNIKIEQTFFVIDIETQKKLLHISAQNSLSFKLKLPFQISELIDKIEKISKTFHFHFLEIFYYPFVQELTHKDKTIKLNLIHNQILKQLFLYKDGILKADLYKSIWPNDKDYQVGKLDTHISNLKSFIKQGLDREIFFESNSGLLKIKI